MLKWGRKRRGRVARRYLMSAGLAAACVAPGLPGAETQGWRDALDEAVRDLPDLQTMRMIETSEFYRGRFLEAASRGATDEERGESVTTYLLSAASMMALCSLVYTLNAETTDRAGSAEQRSADLSRRHLYALAVAASGVFYDIEPAPFANMLLKGRVKVDRPMLDEWAAFWVANGVIRADHAQVNDYCNRSVMRPITDIENGLGG